MNDALAFVMLRRAYRLIDSGKEEFICHALDAAVEFADEADTANLLKELITEGLQAGLLRNSTLGGWLYDTLFIEVGKDYAEWCYCSQGKDERVHLARLAWIDKMCENLKTKGTLA